MHRYSHAAGENAVSLGMGQLVYEMSIYVGTNGTHEANSLREATCRIYGPQSRGTLPLAKFDITLIYPVGNARCTDVALVVALQT